MNCRTNMNKKIRSFIIFDSKSRYIHSIDSCLVTSDVQASFIHEFLKFFYRTILHMPRFINKAAMVE